MRIALILLLTLLSCSFVEATNWCNHANNQGCFLMEDSGTESNESINSSDGLTVSAADTIPQDTDRKFGDYSRDFELGDAEYLTQGDSLSTDISGANQSLSIVTWIKPESEGSGFRVIVSKYSTSSQRQYSFHHQSVADIMDFTISSNGTTTTSALGATGLTANGTTWYHVAAVYNDTDMRIYIDGVLDSNGANNPKAYTSGINDGTAAFMVGNRASTAAPYDGLIDDVGIFDTALSSTDVNAIMNLGLIPVSTASRKDRVMIIN